MEELSAWVTEQSKRAPIRLDCWEQALRDRRLACGLFDASGELHPWVKEEVIMEESGDPSRVEEAFAAYEKRRQEKLSLEI